LALVAGCWQLGVAATFNVTNTNDSGPGSLRDAVSKTNANTGPDAVAFDTGVFPPGSTTVITLASPVRLSDMSGGTRLEGDGRVRLTSDTAEFNGIEITSGSNVVRGLQIVGFSSGVVLVRNTDAANNVIGGALPSQRNVISNNWLHGIALDGPGTANNRVIGNYIGLDPTGSTVWGEQANGVDIAHGAHDNVVGGMIPGERNVISGNTFVGVGVSDTTSEGTRDNHIRGNYIGTDHTGMFGIPNNQGGIGIGFDATGTVIGGTEPGAGNVISGHTGLTPHGIRVGTLSSGNFIYGNIIGLTADGLVPLPNEFGIFMAGDTNDNQIGGLGPNESNIISGNTGWGVAVGDNSQHNVIEGNYIGTNPLGEPLGNRRGIRMGASSTSTAQDNRIGPANRIWFNTEHGVLLDAVTTFQNVITQNSITANGEGNPGRGIILENGANAGIQPPAITSVTESEVAGTASAPDGSIIEIFQDEGDQGEVVVGSAPLNGGLFVFTGTSPVSNGNLTATVTDPVGNTSEFSLPVPNALQPPTQTLEWAFTKIVDMETPVPGGTGDFDAFSNAALSGQDVAFIGIIGGVGGIYIGSGGVLSVVVDESTPIPDGSGNFTFFSGPWPSLDGGDVAFVGQGAGGLEGIYKVVGGVPSVVADTNTEIPGGSGSFTDLLEPSLDEGAVAFRGLGVDQVGVYADVGGILRVVADTGTPMPDAALYFEAFGFPSLDDASAAFIGAGGEQDGIYRGLEETISVLANSETPIPEGSGNFITFPFNGPSASAGNVAFRALGSGQDGVYVSTGEGLAMIADKSTPIPSSGGNFTAFGDPSLDGENVAFWAQGVGQEGIYTNVGGSLARIVDLNTTLDGQALAFVRFGKEGLSGTSAAFLAGFTDGTQAIYRADLATVDPGFIQDVIESLPDDIFNGAGTETAFLNVLESIQGAIDRGQIDLAIRLLERRRTFVDGCDGTPDEAPDANDWILDCDAQREVRTLIDALIADLIAGGG
jgi:hypothetical protein